MKTTTHLITLATLTVTAAAAQAGDWTSNLYLNADVGAVFQQDADFSQTWGHTLSASFNPGVRTDIAIGYNVTQNLALELEPGFMWNSVDALNGHSLNSHGDSIDLYSVPLLANVVYKFPLSCKWVPYVGVGVGANIGTFQVDFPRASYSDTSVAFAYQAEAGVKYPLSQNASVGVAYKFYGTTDQEYTYGQTFWSNKVTLGGVYVHGIFVNFTLNF